MTRDFDDNEFPLAYLISFRCYGTWLHGDKRGSVNRKQNRFGTPRLSPNPKLVKAERKLLKHRPIKLNAQRRSVVENAIREVCCFREYLLLASTFAAITCIRLFRLQSNRSQYYKHSKRMRREHCARRDCYHRM